MTDKTEPEALTDADLNGAQGGMGKLERTQVRRAETQPDKAMRLDGKERLSYIGETEKNIVAQSGSGEI